MAIVDEISTQMKDAMRAKDKPRLGALRGIRAALIEAMKADGSDTLSDDKAVEIMRRLAKQRNEAAEEYDKGGRDDLAQAERAELAVIEEFLPKLADEATTRAWVEEAVAATGASSQSDMGKVMGYLMRHHKGDVDGGLANKLAREALS